MPALRGPVIEAVEQYPRIVESAHFLRDMERLDCPDVDHSKLGTELRLSLRPDFIDQKLIRFGCADDSYPTSGGSIATTAHRLK